MASLPAYRREGVFVIVRYIDLQTGRKAEDYGISVYELTEGNWSCDCNRRIPFDGMSESNTCDGAVRFIAYDVEAEPSDGCIDATEVLRDANLEYYKGMSR